MSGQGLPDRAGLPARPLPGKRYGWLFAALLCAVAAAVLLSPASFGLKRSLVLNDIRHVEGYQYRAPLPAFFAKEPSRGLTSFREKSWLLEDGRPLAPGDSPTEKISTGGWGQFAIHSSGEVCFSSSDGTDPLGNGRRYEVVTSAVHVSDLWILLLFLGSLFFLRGFLHLSGVRERLAEHPNPARFRLSSGVAALGVAAALAGSLLLWPGPVSALFFTELLPSALWALSAGILIASERAAFRLGGGASLLIPIAASFFHFAVFHASRADFIAAGLIPRGDAFMHFLQAAQLALHGVTPVSFNGRFLYPAFFSSLLFLTGLNMAAAQTLAATIFALALYLAMRAVSRWSGIAGTSLFALLIWIFFRDRCAWLVMTEALGLIFGLLALPLLLGMVERRSFWRLLLALFLLSLGLSARPGALFLLPMLILFAGWAGWRGWMFAKFPSFSRILVSLLLAAFVAGAGFSSNKLLQTTIFRGEALPFGNFAYTLNGLLTGGNWADSYYRLHGDAQAVMKENIALLKAHPGTLPQGVLRAYATTWNQKFLFTFESERRLAGLLWLLAIAAMVALWREERLRDQALWISLCGVGVLLSIPFAPPWDAADRPYAATIPFQMFLPALGLPLVIRLCLAEIPRLRMPLLSRPASLLPTALLAAGVLFLTFLLPMAHAFFFRNAVSETNDHLPPKFLPGSYVLLEGSRYDTFREGLGAFAGVNPGDLASYLLLKPGCLLGINWANLDCYAVLPGVQSVTKYHLLNLDDRLFQK